MKTFLGAVFGAFVGVVLMLVLATCLILAGFDLSGGFGFLVGFGPPLIFGLIGMMLGDKL